MYLFAYSGYEASLYLFRQYYYMKSEPLYVQLGDFYKYSAVYDTKEDECEIYYEGNQISPRAAEEILRRNEKIRRFFTFLSPIASVDYFVTNYE